MILTKQDFLTAKPRLLKVDLPDLEGEVFVKSLTPKQMEESQVAQEAGATGVDLLYKQVLACVCDDEGRRIFDDSDKALIENLPFRVVKKLADAVNDASGIDPVPN